MPPGRRPRLLLVDDDEANLRTFRRVFLNEFEMTLASSGPAALDELRRGAFDAALVDYTMPGMNGAEVLVRMQREHPGVARFMLTAHGEIPEISRLLETGTAVGVLMKPWDLAEIEQAIASVVTAAQAQGAVETQATVKR
jgi:CheY-like chemotaxis protein